jgi:4-amino-4-deoxychorismate lyase
MSAPVWINGSATQPLDPAERGLAYGDGLFETLRVRHGRSVLLERHWQRLLVGCMRLGIALDVELLRAELEAFLAGREHGVLKITVTRGAGGRGYLPPSAVSPTRILAWYPEPAYPPEWAEQGVRAGLCAQRLGDSPMLAGLKHLNRLEQVLLRQELEQLACAEALVCNGAGQVVEGVFSNVFMVSHGELLTPSVAQAGVAGVMRAELLARAPAMGMAVRVAVLVPDDFLRADEAFFCNSVYGIWPVRELAGHVFNETGELTRRLQQALLPLFH